MAALEERPAPGPRDERALPRFLGLGSLLLLLGLVIFAGPSGAHGKKLAAANLLLEAPPALVADARGLPRIEFGAKAALPFDSPIQRLHRVADLGLDPAEYVEKSGLWRRTLYSVLAYPERFSSEVGSELRFRYAGGLKLRGERLVGYRVLDAVSREWVGEGTFQNGGLPLEREPVASFYEGGARFSRSLGLPDLDRFGAGFFALELRDDAGDLSPLIYFNRLRGKGAQPRVVFVIPELTWHAYNLEGGANFYGVRHPQRGSLLSGHGLYQVSTQRPLLPDVEEFHRPAFAADFLRALREVRPEAAAVSDMDLCDAEVLEGVELVVFGGHCEYWTESMRETLDGFLARGGQVANFSGNICWWLVRLDDARREIFVSKNDEWPPQGGTPPGVPAEFAGTGPTVVLDPPQRTFGLSWRYGGYDLQRRFPSAQEARDMGIPAALWERSSGLRVVASEHPAFEGTGLGAGEVWGQGSGLVAVEIDAAPVDEGVPPGLAPECRERFPADLEVLATAPLFIASNSPWSSYGEVREVAVMTLCRPFPEGGRVLSVGSVGFGFALSRDPTTRRIFANILRHLEAGN